MRGFDISASRVDLGDATIALAPHGLGFERITACTGGPSVRQNGPTIVPGGSKGEHAYAATAKRQISRASRGRRR
jgi:hypothetical protein